MARTDNAHPNSLSLDDRKAVIDLRRALQRANFWRLDDDQAADVRRRFQAVVGKKVASPDELSPVTRQQAFELLAARVPLDLWASLAAAAADRPDDPTAGLLSLTHRMQDVAAAIAESVPAESPLRSTTKIFGLSVAQIEEAGRQAGEEARAHTFAMGRPVVYMEGDKLLREYPDGRIEPFTVSK